MPGGDGRGFVRHYLIDFGASLGSASYGPNSPRSGGDYLFAWGPASRQFLTLGGGYARIFGPDGRSLACVAARASSWRALRR